MTARLAACLLTLLGGLTLFGPAARAAEATQPGPWEKVRDDNGITVVRRPMPGTSLHEFRGTGLIEAPIAAILGVLNDAEHRTEWMKEAVAQVTIEQQGDSRVIFYSRTAAPWPVADRDVILQATTTFDTEKKMVRIEIESVTHPKWPPFPKLVRMPFLRGHWYFWPENGGKWTRAEYQVHANPAGMLSDWIINMVSKKIPHDTLSALRKQVGRRRYPEFENKILQNPAYQAVVSTTAAPAQPSPPPPSPAP